MKPTQQEIIELAREAGVDTYPEWLHGIPTVALERLVHLALERFGAGGGGGEPVAHVHVNHITGNPSVHFIPGHPYLQHGDTLYTHPSPTDLHAEYLRGLEDAAKLADGVSCRCLHPDEIAEAIRELKGKQ